MQTGINNHKDQIGVAVRATGHTALIVPSADREPATVVIVPFAVESKSAAAPARAISWILVGNLAVFFFLPIVASEPA
jgi:hypothetical protein